MPLCGKSRDLTWLARERGHSVVGVEVAEPAIRDYIEERSMTAMRSTDGGDHANVCVDRVMSPASAPHVTHIHGNRALASSLTTSIEPATRMPAENASAAP